MYSNRVLGVKNLSVCLRKMSTTCDLLEIFQKSVESVQPATLLENQISVTESHLVVRNEYHALGKRCHVIGFGKAVKDMALKMESILGEKMQRAVVTVPIGIFRERKPSTRIEFIEGAKNNLPDKLSMGGALRIKELVQTLAEDDMLIVLVSGGGSALLPLPIPPITLQEKHDLIKQLARKGATINELNSVRKRMSVLKGGGLAELAYPCKVVTLVLSDVIGDPLDFIASGPMVPNSDKPQLAIDILKKYELLDGISSSIQTVLYGKKDLLANVPIKEGQYAHVDNYIIGNNLMAATAASAAAISKGYQSKVVSTCIQGDVICIAKSYAMLTALLARRLAGDKNNTDLEKFLKDFENRHIILDGLKEEIMKLKDNLCLIFAGEPTVVVAGTGKGGRNQQLALNFAVELTEHDIPKSVKISFLSCGTDGIDGPTDAAGAISPTNIGSDWKKYAQECLDNNDAYRFFQKWDSGANLVKIGHTGTNVMDIHVLIVEHYQ
ncbi:unnamed protein product [Acanthoscelides obtectus]|uniref:Glycerate kinase n=1 Tax=Acanthoscelides obtectus TaxID=200917 RepID=A0A9P0JKP2_ACAOB|nr:unnamed protein product [Acanthoscelides obtectus]CAK1672991.1 Glycerate kinase [Acanthoscelides obtectus]